MFEEEEERRENIHVNQFSSLSLSEDELRAIFEAKCQDFRLKFDEKAFQRFLQRQSKHNSHKVVHLGGCGLGPIAASLLVNTIFLHSKIVAISFSDNFLGDEGAKCFADLIYNTKCIISMDLSSNHMTDSGLKTIFTALCNNKSMIDLNIGSKSSIGRNSIGPLTIQEIEKMLKTNKVLSGLNLQMTELNSSNIRGLLSGFETNKTLTSLNISNNHLRSKGAILLFKSLAKSSLEELYLSDNSIQDDIAPFFVTFLQNCKTILKIDLSGNQLGFRLTTAIAGQASFSFTVKHLILARNPLGNRGISCFAPYLSNNDKLERLNVNGCHIELKGFIDFCEELSKNESLKIIEIQHNQLTDSGIVKLSESIVEHPTLKILDLEMTEISDEGCKALFESISSPTSKIVKLNLKNNLINSGIIIQKALQDNMKLLYLNIEFNNIEYKSTLDIEKLMQRNIQNYRANEKQRLFGKVFTENENAPLNIEKNLLLTRSQIKKQREIIRDLKAEKERLEKLLLETTEHRIKTINDLEELNASTENDFINMVGENRNQRVEIIQKTQDIEMDISSINAKLAREVETSKQENKNLNSLIEKVEFTQKDFESKEFSLNEQVKDAKAKYREAKELLIAAWNNLKYQKEIEENQSTKKVARSNSNRKNKSKSSRKNTKKKSTKDADVNTAEANKIDDGNNKEKTADSSSKDISKNSSSKNTGRNASSKLSSSKHTSASGSASSAIKTPINEEQSQLIQKDDDTFDTQPPNTKILQDGDI